jgi:hypothetical protein
VPDLPPPPEPEPDEPRTPDDLLQQDRVRVGDRFYDREDIERWTS